MNVVVCSHLFAGKTCLTAFACWRNVCYHPNVLDIWDLGKDMLSCWALLPSTEDPVLNTQLPTWWSHPTARCSMSMCSGWCSPLFFHASPSTTLTVHRVLGDAYRVGEPFFSQFYLRELRPCKIPSTLSQDQPSPLSLVTCADCKVGTSREWGDYQGLTVYSQIYLRFVVQLRIVAHYDTNQHPLKHGCLSFCFCNNTQPSWLCDTSRITLYSLSNLGNAKTVYKIKLFFSSSTAFRHFLRSKLYRASLFYTLLEWCSNYVNLERKCSLTLHGSGNDLVWNTITG